MPYRSTGKNRPADLIEMSVIAEKNCVRKFISQERSDNARKAAIARWK